MVFLFILFAFISFIFVFLQSLSLFGGDAGDLLTAICVGGIPHPQGYPLYTILGRILYQIPLFTPAWRVNLLSSLPAAGTIVLVFYLIWRLTKSKLAGLVGSLSLAFSYLFWLYASVPELFSLNNFFLIVLLLLTVLIIEEKKLNFKKIYLFSLIAGLSIAHHYFSLWNVLLCSFFVFWYQRQFWQEKTGKRIFKLLLLFFIGWLPYLYIPLVARNYPVISWENADNFKNFLVLISRANYGGFITQSIALNTGVQQRLVLFLGGIKLTLRFFSPIGFVLFLLGFFNLFFQKRKIFWFFLVLFFGSLFALSYTGFSLDEKDLFGLGIYSRFTLPTMVIFGILLGFGSFYLAKFLGRFFSFSLFPTLVLIVFLLIPFNLFIKNSPKILALKNDFTAENFARDILSTVGEKGILILEEDTPVFNTWYVHYCLKEYPNISVLPVYPYHLPILQKNFPELVLPRAQDNLGEEIIKLNHEKLPIFNNSPYFFASGSALPVGLLWRYFPPGEKVFSLKELFEINKKIWNNYHNPLEGILSWFRPVTLAEVLRYYNNAAKNIASFLLNGNEIEGAKEFSRIALNYNPKDKDAYLILGQTLSKEGRCFEAESSFKIALLLDQNFIEPYFYLSENAKNCFKDKQKEERFRKIFEEKKQTKEIKLEKL